MGKKWKGRRAGSRPQANSQAGQGSYSTQSTRHPQVMHPHQNAQPSENSHIVQNPHFIQNLQTQNNHQSRTTGSVQESRHIQTPQAARNRQRLQEFPPLPISRPLIPKQSSRPSPPSKKDRSTTLSAMEELQNLTKEWSPGPCYGMQPFTKLPHDIAMCILDYLEHPVDKVAFALTTKSLWNCMKSKLQLEQYKLPHVIPGRVNLDVGVIRPWPYFESLRWKLLERLEDNYWKCCAGCLRLQPKSEFWTGELGRTPNDRYCRAPGLIQLCPHLILTHKKCENLQKALSKQTYKGKNKFNPAAAEVNKFLSHECKLATGATKITLTLRPVISDRKKHLIFQNTWTVENFEKDKVRDILGRFENSVPLPCPHRSVLSQCLDMLEGKAWNPDLVSGNCEDSSTADCVSCDTLFYRFKERVHSITEKLKLEFSTQRHIGTGFGLMKGKAGHAMPDHLQIWIDKTDLANVIEVQDTCRSNCKCRENCRKLTYRRISYPSWKASLPESRWKMIPTKF